MSYPGQASADTIPTPMDNNVELTISRLAPLIRRKKISPVELTGFLLERIHRLQPEINAYITVTAETALAQARAAEREITKGRYRGVLHGIPVSLKDLIHTRNVRTTAGSLILKRFVPARNAAVVDRLLEWGCVLLGKTNMHEFAYGATNINPHYGPVRNPWDTGRISGGSSGGSAASVVSAQAIASIGTDTGGSIRIPSAACGCVGFKPTFGRVSLEEIIPLSSTLDHAGPITRCVADSAFLLDAIAQPNLWNMNAKKTEAEISRGVRSFRIGIPRQYFFDHVHAEVKKAVLAAAGIFEQLGAGLVEIDLKGMGQTERIAAEITGCEALAYHEQWLSRKSGSYGEDVRLRLEQSRSATAAAYIRTMAQLRAYAQEFDRVFEQEKVEVILAPTLPAPAPPLNTGEIKIGRHREDVRRAMLRLTRPANVSGLPAISLPCGFSSERLPIGLQIIGRRDGDASVLRVAHAYESATPWHHFFPPEDGPLPAAQPG